MTAAYLFSGGSSQYLIDHIGSLSPMRVEFLFPSFLLKT